MRSTTSALRLREDTKMRDANYLNCLTYEEHEQVLIIEDRSEEVLSHVNPAIIADMRARLKGEGYSEYYDISDRTIDELKLMRQKKKLYHLFRSDFEIRRAFSSVENIREIQKKISNMEIDKKILADYASIRSQDKNIDEVDFYQYFLFDAPLIGKEERLKLWGEESVFDELLEEYSTTHFDVVRLSRESIHLSRTLARLFRERKLLGMFNNFLRKFYGVGL